MTVQLCQISLIARLAIIARQEQAFLSLALKANSLIQQRTPSSQTVVIVPLADTVLVQEILHRQRNVQLIITAPVAKAQRHLESTSAHQVTSAKLEHHNQSDVKMEPSKTSPVKVSVRHVWKVTTVMLLTQLLSMQRYVLVAITVLQAQATTVTSLAQNVSSFLLNRHLFLYISFSLDIFVFFSYYCNPPWNTKNFLKKLIPIANKN